MLIDVKGLRGDSSTGYVYNDLVEREVAQMLSRACGLPASDFGTGVARPEYDFRLGELPVELKITDGVYLPVETSKDPEGLVPSGVAASIAPYILYLSHGHGARGPNGEEGEPCVKVRMVERKWLLRTARKTPPSTYTNGKTSEHATVFYIKQSFLQNDLWLGDMGFTQSEDGTRWLFDTATFVPSKKCAGILQSLNEAYKQGDIE